MQVVRMAKGGRRSSSRSLSRPKKRKFHGNQRTVPSASSSQSASQAAELEESQGRGAGASSSASKLRTLSSLSTPVDVYDNSSEHSLAAFVFFFFNVTDTENLSQL